MTKEALTTLLQNYKEDKIDLEKTLERLKTLPYKDLEYAKIDSHRELRNGYPEVIYGEGKAISHIQGIVQHMLESGEKNILCTRASQEVYKAIAELTPLATYYEIPRIVVVKRVETKPTKGIVTIVTAGTADLKVAEEAAITAEILGNTVERVYDVGVAGIHRLLDNVDKLQKARVLIVVAGMEGALASVIGGLMHQPIIAVPTSIGYGANFSGLAPLLAMLNSCASGMSVVNIDNGFGAAYMASKINKLGEAKEE